MKRALKHLMYLIFLCIFVGCKGVGEEKKVKSIPAAEVAKIDPLEIYLWHISNTGQKNFTSFNTAVVGSDANLSTSHNSATGKGVTVVISDARIDLNHPDLLANADLSRSRDYNIASAPFTGNPTTTDDTDAHGTAVTSLIGAVKNNDIGLYGIAPKSTLVGFNYISSNQTLTKYLDQLFLSGGEPFNYSYGISYTGYATPPSATSIERMRRAVNYNKNIYVVSAGNEYLDYYDLDSDGVNESFSLGNGNLDQTNSYPYSILVAATTAKGKIASYSTPSANNWISAPGGDHSTKSTIGMMMADLVGCNKGYAKSNSSGSFNKNSNGLNPECSYSSTSVGTSFSAPIVTGAVALMKEINPNISWREVKHILASTAVKYDAGYSDILTHPLGKTLAGHAYEFGWKTNGAGYNFHNKYGFGQINIKAALAKAISNDFNLYDLRMTDDLNDARVYTSGALSLPILDESATPTQSLINVDKHNLFIEHVQVSISITHPYTPDLGIELVSPTGTSSKLKLINNTNITGTEFANYNSVTFGTNAFYGERSKGNWILKVFDGAADDTGTLTNWKISIWGNKGDALADVTAPAAPTGLSFTGNTLSFTGSVSGDVARYEACVYETSSPYSKCIDGDYRNLGTNISVLISNYIDRGMPEAIVSGRTYTVRVRAIDTSENASAIASTSWVAP